MLILLKNKQYFYIAVICYVPKNINCHIPLLHRPGLLEIAYTAVHVFRRDVCVRWYLDRGEVSSQKSDIIKFHTLG